MKAGNLIQSAVNAVQVAEEVAEKVNSGLMREVLAQVVSRAREGLIDVVVGDYQHAEETGNE